MQTTAIDAAGQRAIIRCPEVQDLRSRAELDARLGDLTLSVGGSYNHSSVDGSLVLVDAGNPFAGPQDLEDRSLPYAPQWTANFGGTYAVTASFGTFSLTAQYSYTDDAFASLFQLEPGIFSSLTRCSMRR